MDARMCRLLCIRSQLPSKGAGNLGRRCRLCVSGSGQWGYAGWEGQLLLRRVESCTLHLAELRICIIIIAIIMIMLWML